MKRSVFGGFLPVRKTGVALMAFVGILAGLSISESRAHEAGFDYTAPQITTAPTIDGNLDDGVWQTLQAVVWGNINEGGTVPATQNTESWAAYDANNLYVAFRNFTPNPADIIAVSPGHDVDVWADEENEIFIEPSHSGAGPYFHIMVNPKNVTQDEETPGAGAAWEPALQSATTTGADHWILELAIPFADLNLDAAPVGATWGWNFNRHIYTNAEDIWVGWATTGASFHTPARFGHLVFSSNVTAVAPTGKAATTWAGLKSR